MDGDCPVVRVVCEMKAGEDTQTTDATVKHGASLYHSRPCVGRKWVRYACFETAIFEHVLQV